MKKPISRKQREQTFLFLLAGLAIWGLFALSMIPDPDINEHHYIVVVECTTDTDCEEKNPHLGGY